MTAPDSIDDLARRARRWIVLDGLLFETLGAWAKAVPERAVKRTLATWCHRHAWHAELWRTRLPELAGAQPDDGDPSDGDDVTAWLDPLRQVLGDPATATTTYEKLTVLLDPVLAAVHAAVGEHRAAIDARLDGPTSRVLDLVAADLESEIAALRAHIESV